MNPILPSSTTYAPMFETTAPVSPALEPGSSKYRVIEELATLMSIFNQLSEKSQQRLVQAAQQYLEANANDAWWMRLGGSISLGVAVVGGVAGMASAALLPLNNNTSTPSLDPRDAANASTDDWFTSIHNYFQDKDNREMWHSGLSTLSRFAPEVGSASRSLTESTAGEYRALETYIDRILLQGSQDTMRQCDQMVQTLNTLATSIIDRSNRKSGG